MSGLFGHSNQPNLIRLAGGVVRGSSHFLISACPSAKLSPPARLWRLAGTSDQKSLERGLPIPTAIQPSSMLSSCSSMKTNILHGSMICEVSTDERYSPGASPFWSRSPRNAFIEKLRTRDCLLPPSSTQDLSLGHL